MGVGVGEGVGEGLGDGEEVGVGVGVGVADDISVTPHYQTTLLMYNPPVVIIKAKLPERIESTIICPVNYWINIVS